MECCNCDLWKQGMYDWTCVHYINNTCPHGYHGENEKEKS